MYRIGLDDWSGLVMLVVCLGAGSPVMFGLVEPGIPLPAWIGLFATALVAAFVSASELDRPVVRRVAYGTAVIAGRGTVLSVAWAGMLPILLVVTAALGVEVVRLPVSIAVVVLNTAVIALAWSLVRDDPFDIVATAAFYGLIQIATLFSLAAMRRERQLRQRLTRAHVDLQAASALLAGAARTAERLRISRELHDLIGHQLTVLTLELEAARHRQGEAAQEHIARANRVARTMLADVRTTVGTLRAEPAADLAATLRGVGRDIPGLDVTVEVGDDVAADEEQTAALVRTVQEIVTNALRHAQARALCVMVARDGDTIRLTATDDGRGTIEVVPGNGLRGIAERFAALDGHVAYHGGSGFRVTARMPVRCPQASK